jgi:pimeloyl-ACP methyl ester carboxylesterase
VITGAGHWPQWEAPEEFVAVHRRFLTDGRFPGEGA